MIFLHTKKSDFLIFLKFVLSRLYQIFETGLSIQSHKQHGRHASAISGYTPAELKVGLSKQQLIKVTLTWLFIYKMLYSII